MPRRPARVLLLAAAVQLVVGWTKSFPVTIGRPHLRVWTHGIETIVILPLVARLGAIWGATGAALAVLAGMCVFAAMWAWIFLSGSGRRTSARRCRSREAVAEAEAEAGISLGEGARRLGNLAARRRRSGEPRARRRARSCSAAGTGSRS